uniref:Uncharacterized protein n=1 Tax=Trichuris muris TaxID=70415 RepID=A0A5S6QZE3_TRIMR
MQKTRAVLHAARLLMAPSVEEDLAKASGVSFAQHETPFANDQRSTWGSAKGRQLIRTRWKKGNLPGCQRRDDFRLSRACRARFATSNLTVPSPPAFWHWSYLNAQTNCGDQKNDQISKEQLACGSVRVASWNAYGVQTRTDSGVPSAEGVQSVPMTQRENKLDNRVCKGPYDTVNR